MGSSHVKRKCGEEEVPGLLVALMFMWVRFYFNTKIDRKHCFLAVVSCQIFTTKMKVDVSLAQDKPCTQAGCFPARERRYFAMVLEL